MRSSDIGQLLLVKVCLSAGSQSGQKCYGFVIWVVTGHISGCWAAEQGFRAVWERHAPDLGSGLPAWRA